MLNHFPALSNCPELRNPDSLILDRERNPVAQSFSCFERSADRSETRILSYLMERETRLLNHFPALSDRLIAPKPSLSIALPVRTTNLLKT
ncbi:hypothetical protein QUA00_15180 [Microcoleus sp. T2B6]|uniref:hypothetical protein n=1 Tax=Microcoleus sp. T2B6 TaxID=3055424 RepID=UPI002FCFD316